MKDFKGAIDEYDIAIRNKADYAKAFNNRGLAKGNVLDHKGALMDFTAAIDIDSHLGEAYYNRGASKLQFGDKFGACLDWSRAGELGFFDAYDRIKKFCN